MKNILIIEDKKSLAEMLKKALQLEGYEVKCAFSLKEGLERFSTNAFDAIVADLKLPDGDSIDIIKLIREQSPQIPIIIMTAYGSIEVAVKAVKEGAYDFITKPFDPDHLLMLLKKAIMESYSCDYSGQEKVHAKEEKIPIPAYNRNVIGVSPQWLNIIEKVKKVAPLKTTVLLLGESGTGKELLAKLIHQLSSRSNNPFIAVNCAAIPKDLVENELFGHEKGAFTGALEVKQGKFELADGGTIFLDEIGDMPLNLQSKLLRVLQESEIERVGGARPIKIDVRVIAASNKDLFKQTREGTFREDLYYRLNVFPITIPPLRERKEDIIPLARNFLSIFCKEIGKDIKGFSAETEKKLLTHSWKGNVRELKNVIERAIILCDGPYILPRNIYLEYLENEITEGHHKEDIIPLHKVVESTIKAVEKVKIQQALIQTKGNKTRASELLGISYKTLLTKIKEYNLE